MTFTQRFYPKFIEFALKTEGGDNDPPMFLIGDNIGYVYLFNNDSEFDFDTENLGPFVDINDNPPSAYYAVRNYFLQKANTNQGIIEQFTFGLTRTGSKVIWNIPNIFIENLTPKSFRQGVIFHIQTDNSSLSNTTFAKVYPMIHLDFGTLQSPQVGFTIKQNPACLPHIDFTPIACSLGGNFDYNYQIP